MPVTKKIYTKKPRHKFKVFLINIFSIYKKMKQNIFLFFLNIVVDFFKTEV